MEVNVRFETEPSEKSAVIKGKLDLNNMKGAKSPTFISRRRFSFEEDKPKMSKKQPNLFMTLLGDKEIDHDLSDGVSSSDSYHTSNNLATTEDSGKRNSVEIDGSSG